MRRGLGLKDLPEPRVVLLGDRVLGVEPDVQLLAECVRKDRASEAGNRLVRVEHAHRDARRAASLELVHEQALWLATLRRIDQLHLARPRDHNLLVAVDVAERVTRDDDWLLPHPHAWRDVRQRDRLTEDGAVHDRADRPVGTWPLLLE